MLPDNTFNFYKYRLASLLSLLIASLLIALSFYIGKKEFFLLLNNDFGLVADFTFKYLTYAGEGLL